MDLLDIVILALVAAALLRGYQLGAVVQVFSYGGFWAGLLAGAALTPTLTHVLGSPASRLIGSLLLIFGAAAVLGGVGRMVGGRIWASVQRTRLAPLDRFLGSAVSSLATLIAIWAVGNILHGTQCRTADQQLERSTIMRHLNQALPAAPSVLSRIERLIGRNEFPDVFANLVPHTAPPAPLPSNALVRQAALKGEQATVQITSRGCGEILEGSGILISPTTVLTNAHVVAGTDHITVIDGNGNGGPGQTINAFPVLFDPREDVAVLQLSSSVHTAPLALDHSEVSNGTQGAVLGYPLGGQFQARAAAVQQLIVAVGRDIYNAGITQRHVYEVRAVIQEGNSGGPLIEPSGLVIGVVFSRSASDPNIGYALTSAEVAGIISHAGTSAVGTGNCAS